MKLTQYLTKSLELRQQAELQSKIDRQLTSLFHNKPFYCSWTYGRKLDTQQCCFNHIVGLPKKNGIEHNLYQYEQDIVSYLETDNPTNLQNKHLYVLKSAGLGLTTLLLRYVAWKCLASNEWSNGRVCILTAPRIDLTIDLVNRLKALFPMVQFKERDTVCYLNNVLVEAFPSHLGLKGMRGLTDIRMIVCDEASFFDLSQVQEARETIERYWAKSNPIIVLCSTPNRPNDLMDQIRQEPESECIYHRMYLSYKTGLGKIYTEQEIELQRKSPSFEKEYNLRFEYGSGNVFHYEDIDAAITDSYDIEVTSNPFATRYMGLDPAWGSSKFGVVIVEWYDGSFRVLYADSWHRPLFETAIEEVITLAQAYNCCKLLCDGANPSVVKSLKKYYGPSDYLNYDRLKPEIVDKWAFSDCEYNKVVPLNWREKHRELLQKAHQVLSKRQVKIHPKFTKLITSLRTATNRENSDTFDLDKQKTTESDVLDSFIAAMYPVQLRFQM